MPRQPPAPGPACACQAFHTVSCLSSTEAVEPSLVAPWPCGIQPARASGAAGPQAWVAILAPAPMS